jgi:hypothetical protein
VEVDFIIGGKVFPYMGIHIHSWVEIFVYGKPSSYWPMGNLKMGQSSAQFSSTARPFPDLKKVLFWKLQVTQNIYIQVFTTRVYSGFIYWSWVSKEGNFGS